jgi:drug/metabolite transporter (DMT)-like permease
VLLREGLSPPVVAGMVVILTGVVLTNLRRAPRREPAIERDSAAA